MASNSKSILQFLGYTVSEISYTALPLSDSLKEGTTISFEPTIRRSITKRSETKYDLLLSVNIEGGKGKLPFDVNVKLIGHFQMENVEKPDEIMRLNATAILFPYVRSTVSQLTTLANISPLTLPTYNIAEMLNDLEQTEAKKLE